MQEQINKQIMASLADILGMIKDAGHFVITQLPSYVQQLVSFYTANYILWLVIFFVLFIWSLIWNKKTGKFSEVDDMDGWLIVSKIGVICGFVAGLIGTIVNLVNLLKITIAPKMWLVEYITNLVASAAPVVTR